MSVKKPEIITRIEQVINREIHPAPAIANGLMACKKDRAKYRLDEQQRLVGLNLAGTGLEDEAWQEIVTLLAEEGCILEELNLSDNGLVQFVLPPGMAGMRQLDLEDNSLTYPPPEVTERGRAAVLRFLRRAAEEGVRDGYEVKMLIVGEGETGKTTLWEILQNPEYSVHDSTPDSTLGIQIREGWDFPHPDLDGERFLVNLWDFGGQEIQYMTHQYFLTRRSFYVLLADGRRDAANFPYWLDIISLLGWDSRDGKRIPVLVVLNEKGNQNPSQPYDTDTVVDQYPRLNLIRRDVDFGKRDRRRSGLVITIKKILCEDIGHLPLKIPLSWDAVRTELDGLRRKGRNYISDQEFTELCARHGVSDQQAREDVSRLFHDLGLILHYREPALADFIVLDPQWAVNAIYEILKDRDVRVSNQGRFNQELLQEIWREKGYSAAEQANLLNLMLKDGLEICFRARENDEEIYIAPQLLPEQKPDSAQWQAGERCDTLRYVYHYPFMPMGIIGRLIVRLHEDIESVEAEGWRKVVWKNGVYLSRDNCRVRIQSVEDKDQGRKIISIEVQGGEIDDRKHVLRAVRSELNKLHRRSFPSLRVFEKVPCNCDVCACAQVPYEHDYADLRKRKEMGKKTAECGSSFERVSVQQLLDGVFLAEEDLQGREEGAGVCPVSVSSKPPVVGPEDKPEPWYRKWWAILKELVPFIGTVVKVIGEIVKMFK